MDVKKYFDRIGLAMPETVVPDSALLKQLHLAHCCTVPYENLDMIRGIPTSLEEEAPAQECSASTKEELSNKPIRLYVSIRTNQGLMIQQNNLTYRQLLSLVEKLEVLC